MRNPNKANGGTPRIISLVIIVSLLLLNFTSCSKQKLSGTYFGDSGLNTIDFSSNGSLNWTSKGSLYGKYAWNAKDNCYYLTIYQESYVGTMPFRYSAKVDGEKLIIEGLDKATEDYKEVFRKESDTESDTDNKAIPPITKLPSVEEFVITSIEHGYNFVSEPPYKGTELWPYEDSVRADSKEGYPDEYYLRIYDSTEETKEWFNKKLTLVKTDEYDEILQGTLNYGDNDDNGYILFDVTHRKGISGQFFGINSSHEYSFYGGIFYCGNRYMEIYIRSVDEELKNSEKDKVDEIMKAYNLPTPR